MTKEQIVSPESFHRWKNDPITQEIFSYLKRVRTTVELDMLDPGVVLGDGGLLKYSKAVGVRHGLDRVLDLQLDDILEDSDNDNEQVLDPSGS